MRFRDKGREGRGGWLLYAQTHETSSRDDASCGVDFRIVRNKCLKFIVAGFCARRRLRSVVLLFPYLQ